MRVQGLGLEVSPGPLVYGAEGFVQFRVLGFRVRVYRNP